MNLVIYEATQSAQYDRVLGEETRILWHRAPELGDQVLIGSNRLWKVVHVESFSFGDASAYYAIVNRVDQEVPPVEDWLASIRKRNQDDPIIYVDIAPDKSIINYGSAYSEFSWSIGERLYTATVTDQGIRTVLSPWMIDRVETLKANTKHGFLSAVRLGWCKEVSIEVAA
jgi:hypothetical protein